MKDENVIGNYFVKPFNWNESIRKVNREKKTNNNTTNRHDFDDVERRAG